MNTQTRPTQTDPAQPTMLVRADAPVRSRRRASVLVLVMTLLGILFVLGITFLTTMNFEADMIAAEKGRGGNDRGADALTDGLGAELRGQFVDAGGVPFGSSQATAAGAAFAELPGVHNVFSAAEPINLAGADGLAGTVDDLNPAFASFTDASRGNGVPVPHGVLLSSTLRNGESIPNFQPPGVPVSVNLIVCRGGLRKGQPCDPVAPEDCPGSTCSGPVAVDADGDGIVDSFLSEASEAGLSPDQINALSVQVNGTGGAKNDVFVALRVVPHGAMANLNASHPHIIEAALGLGFNLTDADGTVGFGSLLHSPSGNPNDGGYPLRSPRSLYSPFSEETLLRRRGLLSPRLFSPSRLQGDPFLEIAAENSNPALPFGGDMANFLFWPNGQGGFESVVEGRHRFEMFAPDEPNRQSTLPPWALRMEPFMAAAAGASQLEYDRRHLVTTVGHDDLLARGGTAAIRGAADRGRDIVEAMLAVNRAAAEADQTCPELFPFEYVRYPHELPDAGDCCRPGTGEPQFDQCTPNVRKGRLQVSLAWIDARRAEARSLRISGAAIDAELIEQRVERVVYDAFFLMVKNAVGADWLSRPVCDLSNNFSCAAGTLCKLSSATGLEGRCSASAAYFDDVECTLPGQPSPAECAPDEFCSAINYGTLSAAKFYCADKWTGLRRSQARLTRTAASLTANLLDFADADDVPTRVAIRMMDFERGMCVTGDQAGRVCTGPSDCGGSPCDLLLAPGRAFDFDADPFRRKGLFVYGLERQPYITEVASVAMNDLAPNPRPVEGRAVELFNPYDQNIILTGNYFLYEVPPGSTLSAANVVPLTGTVETRTGPTAKPFTYFSEVPRLVPPSSATTGNAGTFTGSFQFEPGWTVYLVRHVDPDPSVTGDEVDVVVDQVTIPNGSLVGVDDPDADCTTSPPCLYTVERVLPDPVGGKTLWTVTLPLTDGGSMRTDGTIGVWNLAGDNLIHPVEVNFADTGALASTLPYERLLPGDPANPTDVSFPTTGSMLLLMRYANRAITDLDGAPPTVTAQPLPPIADLGFTTGLEGNEAEYTLRFTDPNTNAAVQQNVVVFARRQIDNGRMPIFDLGEDNASVFDAIGPQAAHHVPAPFTPPWDPFDSNSRQTPGGVENLPWGQLVFDYFTAIPLDSAGPYPPCPGTVGQPYDCSPADSPEAKPRVDLDGLRVHGRVNLNAAPVTVLAGLPFVPMDRIPVAFRDQIRTALDVTGPDNEAEPIGQVRALAITAYRDARRIFTGAVDTGDYGVPTNPTLGVEGWRGFGDLTPKVRRGTGFLSVGELANVRHNLATVVCPSQAAGQIESLVRLDGGFVDNQERNGRCGAPPGDPNADNNDENFIGAAAFLIALNDWAAVRSHVFTIYGHIRGVENEEITDPKPAEQVKLRREDVDSRAIRFQETVDRLPTFLGKSLPVRIGDRTVGAYLDENND